MNEELTNDEVEIDLVDLGYALLVWTSEKISPKQILRVDEE